MLQIYKINVISPPFEKKLSPFLVILLPLSPYRTRSLQPIRSVAVAAIPLRRHKAATVVP